MKSCRHVVPDHNLKELYLVGSINASQLTLIGHLGVIAKAFQDDKDSEAAEMQAEGNISRVNSIGTQGHPARHFTFYRGSTQGMRWSNYNIYRGNQTRQIHFMNTTNKYPSSNLQTLNPG